MADDTSAESTRGHRPKTTTVFVAAFVAGAVAAVVVNRALDLHLAQSRPQVESEPIFVALRPLPQGSPVTVWDVALRDWPCAMLPASALRAGDSFEGSVLKYQLREGQPLLAVQLMPASLPPVAASDAGGPVEDPFVMPAPAAPPTSVAQPAVVAAPKQEPKPKQAETALTKAAPRTDVDLPAPALAPKESISAKTTTRARTSTEPPRTIVTESTSAPSRAPAATEPTLAAVAPQPTPVASDVESLLDMASQPAVDLDSIPSVMARSESPAEPIEDGPKTDPVRYLVVPERIARQADTSFVSPPAVEPPAEPAPPIPDPASQPPAIKNSPATAPRNTQATTPKPMKAVAPKAAQSAPSKSAQSAARSNPHQRINGSASNATRAMQQRRPPQPNQQPSRQAARSQQSQESNRKVAEPSPRPWFPNISAGIEAVGNRWRGDGDEAVATDIPSGQRRK